MSTAAQTRAPSYGPTVTLTVVAALLWLANFGFHVVPFWVGMGVSVGGLGLASLALDGRALRPQLHFRLMDLAVGLGSAAVLYGVFFVGDRLSKLMFDFAAPQVGGIYGMANGSSKWAIGLLLVLVLGPGEELFWRGFLQRRLMARLGPWTGYLVGAGIYGAVHIASGNFMLVMAALVAGAFWGLLYVKSPRLWPLIISHAVWDVTVFLILPIH